MVQTASTSPSGHKNRERGRGRTSEDFVCYKTRSQSLEVEGAKPALKKLPIAGRQESVRSMGIHLGYLKPPEQTAKEERPWAHHSSVMADEGKRESRSPIDG